ncbi:unnamed protein product [Strongylus vulgaris]|uniref:Ryanodine receptor junctional solenoid domain-containing protein n=1 Tax=Strongylus vulgaris TaxID=40348 RepID=A0A3P7LJS3_STRVU|nr:unnamed protein product [Strongylus vulgaris]
MEEFQLEPGAMLFPAAFFTPTATEILQFELGRIKYTFPISAAMFKSCHKSLVPFCPPRLTVECLDPVHWARVPNETLRTTSLKLSDIRGWSVLCDDPVRIMAVYVPEKDESFDILEMIEKPVYLDFHRQTLNLYCKLASHGNLKVAHVLCGHVDEDQIMYAVKSHYLSGPMRQGYHDLLIAIHLQSHASARQSMSKEYVIPLCDQLRNENVFDPDTETRFPQIMGDTYSMLPVMVAEPVKSHFTREEEMKLLPPAINFDALKAHVMAAMEKEMKLLPPAINFDALKAHVMAAMESATRHAVMNCRDLIGGLIDDTELEAILKLIHPVAFDPNYEPGTTNKGLTEVELSENVKIQLVNIIDHLCDIQLRHRIESLIGFSETFVAELQQDQCKRYMEIKQTDMPPAEAAKKTKEFRCPPKEQMFRLLKCKVKEEETDLLDDDVEYDQCPMAENLQEQLRDMVINMLREWALGDFIENNELIRKIDMVINMLREWALGDFIENNELIRKMFHLLLRQYSGVREVIFFQPLIMAIKILF